jgi:hypothetical protein
LNRALPLVALAGLLLAACSYAPSPGNGEQLCGPPGGKRCPDGYTCGLSGSKAVCFRNGDGGAPGTAGHPATGTGGAAGITGAGGAAGVSGTGGAAGAGQTACAPATASSWSGSLATINSGSIPGPVFGNTKGVGLEITGNSQNTTAATAAVGVTFTLQQCQDARQYTGVSFSISGTVTGCTTSFQVEDVERTGPGQGGPGISVGGITTAPQTFSVPWTTSNGTPPGQIDAKKIAVFVWGFTIAPATTCSVDLVITNMTFY